MQTKKIRNANGVGYVWIRRQTYCIVLYCIVRHAHGLMHLVACPETLEECRSRRRIGWIIQDFRETCVSRSLTFRLETKMPWRQTPSRKKKAVVFTTVTTDAYQDQLNAGVSKVCEIFKVHGIESAIVATFPRLKKTNCDCFLDMSVKRPHGRALTNECSHIFQTFSRQSEGLAMRD